ncbi:geranylgeranyl transferase type-1 subunit beta-like protein [Dinothrombium tinctorium]|uniref:Geranylgeranyl transferase type-1 subunit beta n=1 Tax=Dinothrombium tinctorium TaxID=1965070 RepID=A0A3S3Q545_9ACAR|nr:geranylgeranyl transferase type-1 subunit beta-like protein [Dinothrombium tinctorium]RWS14137.1 geranylgeranyl transferase type-1 subunit beta-like protein [Dinothrombium tinctorium]RWS14228.1 geranylgeranyl transferase type-1 subunit beta-like protein [Dinothrombium tinctorium]
MALNATKLSDFLKQKHVGFLQRCLRVLPSDLSFFDTHRLSLAFFVISSIDLLNSNALLNEERRAIIDWIYSMQIPPNEGIGKRGFRGSSANSGDPYDFGHLTMIYSALASLIILGDDLKRINRQAIVEAIKELQLEDGSFAATHGSESDMRFVYSAVVVSHILQDWSGIDIDKTVTFIKKCLSYEGGFGLRPGCEAHGGSTYCAVASLSLMDKLNFALDKSEIKSIIRWCVMKQVSGFQGRPNKEPDTCYSFWIGATLKILDTYHFTDVNANFDFVMSTQDPIVGGFGKNSYSPPDPMHTYLGLAGLSLIPTTNKILSTINPEVNISERATEHLRCIHRQHCV